MFLQGPWQSLTPGLSLLAHSGHCPDRSPGFLHPVPTCPQPQPCPSPQQLERTQDHYEIEGLHVEGQSQQSQEGERCDEEVEPRREREGGPLGPPWPPSPWPASSPCSWLTLPRHPLANHSKRKSMPSRDLWPARRDIASCHPGVPEVGVARGPPSHISGDRNARRHPTL